VFFKKLRKLWEDNRDITALLDDTDYDKRLKESQLGLLEVAAGTQNVVESMLYNMKLDLNDERRKIKYLANLLQDALIIVDIEGKIELFNPAAELMFGYNVDDIIDNNITMLMPDKFKDIHPKFMAKFAEDDSSNRRLRLPREVVACKENGEEFPVEITISSFLYNDGTTKLIAMLRDITERKKIEEHIYEKDKTIRMMVAAIEESSDAICIWDKEFKTVFANRAISDAFGYDKESLIDTIPPFMDDSQIIKDMLMTVRAGNNWTGTIDIPHLNGIVIANQVQVTPIMNGLPIPKFYIAIHKTKE